MLCILKTFSGNFSGLSDEKCKKYQDVDLLVGQGQIPMQQHLSLLPKHLDVTTALWQVIRY